MPSIAARIIKLYTRAVIKIDPKSPEHLVSHLRKTMGNPPPSPFPLPRKVRLAKFKEGNIQGDWMQIKYPKMVILYLHGGGYICGKTSTYFPVCGKLAADLDAEIYLPDYRLAPEHRFPAAVEDAVEAYELLLKRGWQPQQICIAGDSAGGGITLATLLKLRDLKRPLPACAVAFSPFADMSASAKSHSANNKSDAILSAKMLELGEKIYVGEADPKHPYASPVFGEFTGLPPLFLTVCEDECLRDDTYEIEGKAKAAGVPITIISRRELLHVWPIFYPLLPEAKKDIKQTVAFIKLHLNLE